MEQYFLKEQMTYGNTTKPFVISDNGYHTYFKPCMGNTDDTQEKFCICFLQIKTSLCFWKDTFLLVFFQTYQFNSYLPLIENKTELLATLQN